MKEDIKYCSSSFLMYRTIVDHNKCFSQKYPPSFFDDSIERTPINNSEELEAKLKAEVEKATANGKAALALSGGIDSAILAKFMPKGSTAYTFQCIVPGKEVTNEVPRAAEYAKECGLEHKVIKVYWEDFEKYAPVLMKHKGAPIHSIEVQIYKAGLQAKADGFDTLIFGESADSVFGGLSNLLSQNWTIGDFIERYQFVPPYKVLKDFSFITEPFLKHVKDGYIDPHEFISTEFFKESVGSYSNALETAKVNFVAPYVKCFLSSPLDYKKVRNGENKYLVREVFNRLYQNFDVPQKTPMPRPMNEWFNDWQGPTRPEFWPHCTDHMTGDQKYYIWSLETFLDLISEGK